jgi:hypothetical protein
MERICNIEDAKQIMGLNFIGPKELGAIHGKLPVQVPAEIPLIPYTVKEFEEYASDYLLILGVEKLASGLPLNILSLRQLYGTDPDLSEPCFYNQDWYLKEDFCRLTLCNKWFLIKKEVIPSTRTVMPDEILKTQIHFPKAVLCAYAFFAFYFVGNEFLWYHDFIWCSDFDHNGDRIYAGKYHDVDGINRNGFSIHRHLALRECYGAINIV